MGEYFEHDDVFPVIANLIDTRTIPDGPYLRHAEITEMLLGDESINRIYERARTFAGYQGTKRDLVANMVAWFSQQITRRLSQYTEKYERARVAGRWAYRRAV